MDFNVSTTYKGDMYCNINYIKGNYNITTSVDHNDYFSPLDLLAASLSACTVSMIASAATDRLPINPTNITMNTKIVTDTADAHKVTGFYAVITIKDSAKLTDKDKAILEKAAGGCPVKKTLSSDLNIKYEFHYE